MAEDRVGETVIGILFPQKAPAPPPPPPNAAQIGSTSIAEAGAMERQRLAAASGEGSDGTNKTGGQGAAAPATTANPGGSTAPKTTIGG